MAGKLYGIGVGPGDPELLTLKAVRIIRGCEVILVPGNVYQDSVAYQIAVQAVPELVDKEVYAVAMPMVRAESELEEAHRRAAEEIIRYLNLGKVVGFLNLGDIALYSTFLYLQQLIAGAGYDTEMISGIPSFCAVAAKLNVGLANGDEPIHILPVPEVVEAGMELPGTKIIMKMGRHMGMVKRQLLERGARAEMVEKCGMPGEKIYQSAEEMPAEAGYYSVVIVRES